ncbi:MAG: hypothetical protein HY808_03660 [Nitrospirae bacterium]|nr:hypothetical protein [Nitrospirota bacterium]
MPVIVPHAKSLDNVKNQVTIETWVYLRTPVCHEHHRHRHCWQWHRRCWFCPLCWERHFQNGSLIKRPGSYELEIGRHRKAVFTLFLRGGIPHPHMNRVQVQSNAAIPTNQWVHLAGVYDGHKVVLRRRGFLILPEVRLAGVVLSPRLLSADIFIAAGGLLKNTNARVWWGRIWEPSEYLGSLLMGWELMNT